MAVNPNLKIPYIINYNLGITHAFGSNLSLEVEYVGNHGLQAPEFYRHQSSPAGFSVLL